MCRVGDNGKINQVMILSGSVYFTDAFVSESLFVEAYLSFSLCIYSFIFQIQFSLGMFS